MMRKLISCLMIAALVCMLAVAYAEEPMRVAGYDHSDTMHVWTENKFFTRMTERTGLALEMEQYDTAERWQAAKAAMFADGGDLPDALFKAELTPQETMQYYSEGKLIDLRPYLEENCPNLTALLAAHPEWEQAITLPDGAIVALPAIDELQFNNALWINQKWLNKLGLKMPATAAELTEVLIAFRDNDMNGNGKTNDEVPLTFSSMWDLRFLAHAFGINANDYYLTTDAEGTVSEVLTSDANREFLGWLNQLYSENLLDENGFTNLRNLTQTTEEDADVVYGVMFAPTPVELVSNDVLGEYELMMPLTWGGQQVYRDLTGDVVRGTFAITSACKDPAALLRWVDYLYTEEGFILAEAGVADEEFYWNDDGTWLWDSTDETLLSTVLPASTIRTGTSMPGYASVPFQQKIDDASTVRIVSSLMALKEVDTLPVPLLWMEETQQTRADELIYRIGRYAEQQMVWFVTGDVPLNDETWQAFCDEVKRLGVDEMVTIFQTALDASAN